MFPVPAVRFETFETIDDSELIRSPCALEPGQPSVWFAEPGQAADPERRARLMALLSNDETQRLARLRFEPDRQLFLVAHALLRAVLSRHEGIDPRAWHFCTGVHGRPEISAPPSRLRFTLTHTRGLAACAVTLDRDIGFDVQHISNDRSIDLAGRVFSPRELHDLRSAPSAVRAVRFFEYWTLKEAYLKARGAGLTLPLDSFSFDRDAQGEWRIAFTTSADNDLGRWKFWSWRVGARHQAALAVSTDAPSLNARHVTGRLRQFRRRSILRRSWPAGAPPRTARRGYTGVRGA